MRLCRRPAWLSSSPRSRSESRVWRSSLRAEVRSCAPSKITVAKMTATSVLSAAIERMRQRIGSERSICSKPAALRPFSAVPLKGVSRCKSGLAGSLHGLDPPDQRSKLRIGAQLVAQGLGRILEGLVVDRVDDGDARLRRLLARPLLPAQPLLAHVFARFARGGAEDGAILGRQV